MTETSFFSETFIHAMCCKMAGKKDHHVGIKGAAEPYKMLSRPSFGNDAVHYFENVFKDGWILVEDNVGFIFHKHHTG
jgi:hypothetical protein